MKTVNLLPGWYLRQRRQERNIKLHVIAMLAIGGLMAGLSLLGRQQVNRLNAEKAQLEARLDMTPNPANDLQRVTIDLKRLQDLQQAFGLTMLFIAHDLAVVEYLCDEVVVMYLGRVMERGPSRLVYETPHHPYTQALLSASPVPDPKAHRSRIVLQGDPPSPSDPPPGCRFHTRCSEAIAACRSLRPVLASGGSAHATACHIVNPISDHAEGQRA